MISFSDFAKLLFPYISNGQKPSEFIIYLITQIMETPYTEEDKQLAIKGLYNPLSKLDESMLNKIYTGTRPISKRRAMKIITHLSKNNFIEFLSYLPDDVQKHIETDLQNREIVIEETPIDTCANLLESILLELAQKKSTRHKHTETPKLSSYEALQSMNAGAKINIPEDCKICLCCKNWKGNAQNAYINLDGIYGTCITDNTKIISTNNVHCEKFIPNYNRISSYLLYKKLGYSIILP